MDTSKGEDIWYCVRLHFVIVEIVAMLNKLEAAITLSLMVREQDSAVGANKRTLAHETNMSKHRMPRLVDRTIEIDVYCLSHNNNHVQDDIIKHAVVGGLSLLNFMFLSARLFQNGFNLVPGP